MDEFPKKECISEAITFCRRSVPRAFCFGVSMTPKQVKTHHPTLSVAGSNAFGQRPGFWGGEVTPTASQNVTHLCAHRRSPPAALPRTGMGAAGMLTAPATCSIDRPRDASRWGFNDDELQTPSRFYATPGRPGSGRLAGAPCTFPDP